MSEGEPLVPPDCDLRGLPWMPIDTVRLLDSDLFALASGEEFKAAVRLWCKAWHQVPAASLPDDDRILAALSGMGRLWPKIRPMALRGFIACSDGRLYHPVIAEKALEAWSHRTAQRARAVKRWHKPGNAAAYATAMQGTETGTVQGQENQPLRGLSGEAPDAGEQPSRKNGHDHERTRQLRQQAIEVLLFLNEKTGRNYQPVPANVDMIVARLKQGASVDDCRAVIAKKCREWAADEKMTQYLRPATLFNATKFAQYQGELAPAGGQQ